VKIERLRYLEVVRIIIKIISGTRRKNKYFFYELYARTRKVHGRRNTRRLFKRANRRTKGRRKGTNR